MCRSYKCIRWIGPTAAFTAALLLCAVPLQARPKTDVVLLKNGDRLTCEIKKLARGKLTVKTDAMGTIDIKWDHIEQITSNFVFRLEVDSGRRYVGSVHPSGEKEVEEPKIVIAGAFGTSELDYANVVGITPLEQSFFQRLKGSVDFGFDFTQTQNATQYNLSSKVNYQTDRYLAMAEYSSLLKEQKDAERQFRNNLSFQLNWRLRKQWFAVGTNTYEQNESQDLNLRVLAGGGMGRFFIQTNRIKLLSIGGLLVGAEQYADGEPFSNSIEAIGAIQFEFFKFDFPEMDLTTTFAVLPSLTNRGRVRLQLDSKVRWEIVKDLYWSIGLYNSFDSRPPTEDFRRNDFGLNTSLGWTF
jgi:hypothetical protein